MSAAVSCKRLLVLIDPAEDAARVRDDRPVGQLQRGHLRVAGRGSQLLARSPAQERNRIAVGGDHLVVVDARGAQRLLHAAARVNPGPAVIAVADIKRWLLGHLLAAGYGCRFNSASE